MVVAVLMLLGHYEDYIQQYINSSCHMLGIQQIVAPLIPITAHVTLILLPLLYNINSISLFFKILMKTFLNPILFHYYYYYYVFLIYIFY